MTLTANVFLKLETAKDMVRKMSKKARFKTPTVNMPEVPKHC